jgi:dihydroflavonol-4-reductase
LHLAYGDVTDQRSLVAAAEGCEAMVHMAAIYSFWDKDPNIIVQTSLEGTRNAFAAAQAAGIRRMVFTSSIWAAGVGKHPNDFTTAADWYNEARNPYAVAKTESEREAWQLAEKLGIEMIAILPGGLIGAYDYRTTPSTATLLGLVNGTSPTFRVGFSYIDVAAVAAVHAEAVTLPKSGERYITAGENVTLQRYGEIVAEFTGKKPMMLPGGRVALQIVATLAELGTAITKQPPLITRALADEVGDRYMYYDCSTTQRDFNFNPGDAKQVIGEGIRWLLHMGQLKPEIAARVAPLFPPDPSWKN